MDAAEEFLVIRGRKRWLPAVEAGQETPSAMLV
jgi:hypothetical protein